MEKQALIRPSLSFKDDRKLVTVRPTHLERDVEAFKIVSTYSLVDTIYEQCKRNPPLPNTSP
ncbi:hypothetical protein, partial [Marinobacter sp.]|uniref:hypothetical protein n=1 Tax=Marinobacter sp. TaxID=50741 RepID=UPI003A8EC743